VPPTKEQQNRFSPDAQQIICLFHAKRNWQTKFKSMLNEAEAAEALQLMSRLALLVQKDEYNNNIFSDADA